MIHSPQLMKDAIQRRGQRWRDKRLTVVSVAREVAIGDVLAMVVRLLGEPHLGAARGGTLDGIARVAVRKVLTLAWPGLVGRVLQAVVVRGELLGPGKRVGGQLLVPSQLGEALGAAGLVVQLERVLLVLGSAAADEVNERLRGG